MSEPIPVEGVQTPENRYVPAGGLTEYVNRVRPDHRWLRGGCSCGQPLCPQRILLDHIDDLVNAYELKVQDLARETARNETLIGFLARAGHEICTSCNGRGGTASRDDVQPCGDCNGWCIVPIEEDGDDDE